MKSRALLWLLLYINKVLYILPWHEVNLLQTHLLEIPHYAYRISYRWKNTHDPQNCSKKRISNQFVTRCQKVSFLCCRTCGTFITPVRAISSTIKYLSNRCNATETNRQWRTYIFPFILIVTHLFYVDKKWLAVFTIKSFWFGTILFVFFVVTVDVKVANLATGYWYLL